MNVQLRVLLIVLIVFVFILFVQQIKKKALKLQYTLTWLALLFFLFIVTVFSSLQNFLSNMMGISLPINLIFFFGFLFMLAIVYRLTEAISKQSEQIKDLAQKIALMEKEINDKHK